MFVGRVWDMQEPISFVWMRGNGELQGVSWVSGVCFVMRNNTFSERREALLIYSCPPHLIPSMVIAFVFGLGEWRQLMTVVGLPEPR